MEEGLCYSPLLLSKFMLSCFPAVSFGVFMFRVARRAAAVCSLENVQFCVERAKDQGISFFFFFLNTASNSSFGNGGHFIGRTVN